MPSSVYIYIENLCDLLRANLKVHFKIFSLVFIETIPYNHYDSIWSPPPFPLLNRVIDHFWAACVIISQHKDKRADFV